MGRIIISFLGPPPNDFLTRKALDIIRLYLTSSTVAPLNKEYIEIDSPLWYVYARIVFRKTDIYPSSSYFYFCTDVYATNVNLDIWITSVPIKYLETFNEKLTTSLKLIVENGIDMQRMAMIINRDERQVCGRLKLWMPLTSSVQLRSILESSKGDHFSENVITDVLYGAEDGSELHPSMDEITMYNILRTWTSSQWAVLLSK